MAGRCARTSLYLLAIPFALVILLGSSPGNSDPGSASASLNEAVTQTYIEQPFAPSVSFSAEPIWDKERFELLAQKAEKSSRTLAQGSDDEAAQADLATLAKKANNPISDAWLLITQNDFTLLEGDATDDTEVFNSFKFQPVISAPVLDGDWNFVVRPVLQFNSVPLDEDVDQLFGVSPNDIVANPSLSEIASSPFGRTTGLGDTVLLTLLGPNTDDGWIYAGGVTQIFPTASEDVLGQGKWQIGPAALVARLGANHGEFDIDSFNIGALAQQWWSYAGDDDRDGTNQADIQYFLNWKANPTTLIGMTPNIAINWDANGGFDEKVALPVGLGVIDMFRIGKLPVRWGIEGQYYLTGPDELRREANLKIFVAPIIPNLLK